MKFIYPAAICLLISIHEIHTVSVAGKNSETIAYLQSFGYLPEAKNNKEITHKELKHALKKLQKTGNITPSGKVDDDTINLMETPRCGVPDSNLLMNHRQKRYDLLSTKWDKHQLTWNVDPRPFERDEEKIKRAIRETFKIWTEHSMLSFNETKKHDDADIRISFQKNLHRDLDPYELDGTTLAHAFQPGTGVHGDAHFKIDVQWDFDVLYESPAYGKSSFFSVALHELGHTIGLGHSPYEDAVMYPFSLGAGKLSKDDIKGIQHIYGIPKTTEQESSTPTFNDPKEEDDDRPIWDTRPMVNTSEIPDKCSTSYDAIATLRKELFIFKGKYFWRPESSDKKAVEIHQFWSGLPSNLTHVDAVYENDEGQILFFINQKLYIFEWREFEQEFSFTRIGLGELQKVDMVFKWPYNNVVYLFAGDYYWRYDEKVNAIMRNSRKLTKRAFKDVYDMDTVFVQNKTTYFFKGLYFYEFDDRIMRLHRMQPKVSAAWFMGCDLPKKPPAPDVLGNRFGDDVPSVFGSDIINMDEKIDEIPDDDENPEKKDDKQHDDVTKEPDSAGSLELIISLILASFIVSQLSPSILL